MSQFEGKEAERTLTEEKVRLLVLFRFSDCVRPTHIREGNFYHQYTDLNVNFIQNTLTETLGIMLGKKESCLIISKFLLQI